MISNNCIHGQLKRQCELCDAQKEIESLRAKLARYEEAEKQEPIGEVWVRPRLVGGTWGQLNQDYQDIRWLTMDRLESGTKLYTRTAPIPEGYALVPKPAIDFLMGAGELDGFAFGEQPEGKPKFWWRSVIQEMLTAAEEKQ